MVRTQRFIGIILTSLFSMKSTPLETNKQKIENKLFFFHIVPAHTSFGDFQVPSLILILVLMTLDCCFCCKSHLAKQQLIKI